MKRDIAEWRDCDRKFFSIVGLLLSFCGYGPMAKQTWALQDITRVVVHLGLFICFLFHLDYVPFLYFSNYFFRNLILFIFSWQQRDLIEKLSVLFWFWFRSSYCQPTHYKEDQFWIAYDDERLWNVSTCRWWILGRWVTVSHYLFQSCIDRGPERERERERDNGQVNDLIR